MESKDGSSSTHLAYTNRHVPIPLSPYPFLPSPYSDDFSQLHQSNGDHLKSSEGGLSYHQRCSSESFLFDEEPSWLDDLLDEPETVHYKGHRRSASDSYAYLGETVENLNIGEEYGCENVGFRSSKVHNYADQTFFATKTNSLAERKNQQEIAVSSVAVEQTKDENSSKNSEDSADKVSGGSQVKPYASKAEGKRAKQHNAHRSRTRKLQYIVHLEKTVEILKAEGSEVSAELEFLEQQNMILTMENRALRQRLDSVSQEQAIKQWEQGMLEREIARLQTMFHVQKQQQQLQQQHSHNHQHYKHRRNRSKDFDHQVNSNNNPIKMKDAAASSSKALPNAPVWA